MRRENKNPRKILFSVLIAIAFVVLAGIKLGYANIISPKQGINEYHFYNDTIENKDSAKEIQKQIILDGKEISDPGHVFKDKDKVLLKWQDEEGNDIEFDTPIEIKGNDKKIINVYPVFKNQVVITYYISGSTNDRVYMTDTITDASSYKLPVDPTIYDANKYFVNWSTSKDGSSGVYDENSLKKDIEAGKTDIKLYAITEFKHKATFITGEGASFQDQILASKDSKLDKMPEDPTRAGYEFSHWSLAEDGDPVDLNTLVLDKDITVYAVWKPVVVDYKFKVMVQNINDDGYTFHEIISARGLNGDKTSLPFKGSENPDPKVAPSGPIVKDIKKLTEKDGRFNDGYNSKDENGDMDHFYTNPQTLDYLGFHLNEEKTKQAFETIKADGSTVVPVYMDRNVHTVLVYKNQHGVDVYSNNAYWINATDENGDIHVDLRYGQSSEEWFDKLNKDYIYYRDKSIGSFYTKAPVMGDEDVYMYRVYAKGQGFQLRFVEWDPNKFNAQINSGSLDQLKATLGTMKEIGARVEFQNTEHYYNYNGFRYRVYEPRNGMWDNTTYSWVDKTDHVDDIKGFQPKTGDMSADGLQSVNVNNPAFRDYMFAAGKGVGGYQDYTGTPYIEDGSYVGFLFYERKTYNIIYYSGTKRLDSKPYKYEADTSDFGLGYEKGVTKNPNNPNQVFMGWYEDSTFSVEHKHENGAKMPAHDITVYAKWDSRQYEVTFHTNQDDYERDIEKITEIPEDDNLYDGKYKDAKASEENFPQPVKPEGAREFLGWYEKNENNRFVKANLHKPIKNNDTHLYAKWKYDYLELKYDLNLPATDKVEGTAPTDSNSYINDAKALATDVGDVKVNDGKKVFVGWSETKDGSSGLILPSETVLMDKNKTLYAQWKEIPDLPTTKVTYDANGGVGDQHVVEEIITNDSHKVLGNGEGEEINYTREGYAFKGWNRDKNATKAEFQKDDEVTVTSLDESTNNYIYAIWAPIINYTTDGNGQVKEGENFVANTKEEVELKANPKGIDTKAKEGYKFSHWTADKEITLNNGTKIPAGEKITEEQLKQAVITEPLTFTANFVKDKPSEFNVTHEFVSATEGKDLPQAVKDLTPKDQTGKEDGIVVKPTAPTQTEVKDTENDGTWTFEGYKDQDTTTDEVDAKVNGADVKFEGEWKFTPNKHKVTYEYVSGTKGVDLPAELKEKAPKEVTDKVKGDTVTSPVPEGKDATFRDEVNKGTWKFKSYDKDSVEITNKDENVKGTWVFTPDVVTEYVDEDGNTISPKENGTKEKKDIDGYEFVRTETDDKGNTKHIYKKKTTPTDYNVNHKFVSATEGKALPKAVTDLTPDQQTGKKDGETVTPTAPKETKVEDKTNDGTWTFEGYDKDSKTIDKSDITFEGKWKFTPNKHEVIHKFVSKDPNKKLPKEVTDLLPANQTGKVKGDEVKPTEPQTKTVKVKDGTWKFVSYDKDNKTVEDKDVEFTGTWEFIPDVVTEYVDENGKTIAPKEDGKQPNKNIDGYEFVRTEKDDKGNTKHIYKKKVTPPADVVTEYVDEDGNTISPKENGTKEKKDIDGYEFVRTETDDKGNTKHIYKKKTTPSPSIVTKFVDEKGNPLAKDEDGKQDKKDIPGYQFVETKNDKDGNVVHVYKLIPSPTVETRYVDTEGNQILADKAGTHDPSTIEGYQFVKTEKDEKGNTVHIYKKIAPVPKVETRYVDENGNQLLPPKEGTQNQVNIDGYDYVSTSKDNNGNTIHVYKKKVLTPDVVTKYVDENGNEIAETQKGKHPSKNIEGYEIITTKTDEKGNIIYVYRKKPNSTKVVTKFVDENGKTIAPNEDGKKPKKDIKGYEFVRTETDKDGNTVHIYKKKTTPPTEVVTEYVDEDGKTIAPKETGTKDKKDIEGYEFVKTEKDNKGNTKHIYKKKSPSAENKYKVTHKFESTTPGKTLPKEILDLLPKNQEGIENGRKVYPTKPSKLEVKVKDGTWVFEGYDKDSSTIDNKDVNFTGKWKFVPNKIGKVRVSTGANSRSKSNVKTGIEGSSNLIFVLIGSAFALYKNKKNRY